MGELVSPSGEPRVRVLVVEQPALVMLPIVTGLRQLSLEHASSIELVVTSFEVAARIAEEFRRTRAHIVVAFLSSLFRCGLEGIRYHRLPTVLLTSANDALSEDTANRSDALAVATKSDDATYDVIRLVRTLRSVGSAAQSKAISLELGTKLVSRVPQPPLELEREIQFRHRHRRWLLQGLASPIHVDPDLTGQSGRPSSPSARRDALIPTYWPTPTGMSIDDVPQLTLRELLAATGEPGGATEDFAIRALQVHGDAEALRSRVDAILRTGAELSGTLKGHCAKALYRLGEVDRADALLAGITDPDARVLAADIAKERGRDAEALGHVEHAAGARLETLGAVERVARWRDAIHREPSPRRVLEVVPLVFRGQRMTVVFEPAPVLGRVGVAIVVAAPVISRRHLVFRRGDAHPELEDQRSQHGSVLDGQRISSAAAINRPLTLQLAGSIACDVRPGNLDEGGPRAVLVDVAGGRWILTFGGPVHLGPYQLSREDQRLVIRSDRGFFLDGDDDPHRTRTVCDLVPDVAVLATHQGPTELFVEAEAFSPD